MSKPYIDQIDTMIDAHMMTIESLRAEVERLESAKSVILMLRGDDGMGQIRDVTPKAKKSQEITIRKLAGPKKEKLSSKGMDDQAIAVLAVFKDGLKMKDLVAAMDLPTDDKRATNRLWYALDIAIKAGKLIKEEGFYKLPHEQSEAA